MFNCHAAMLNDTFSSCQHLVSCAGDIHAMDPVWRTVETELARRDLGQQWLADRLEMSVQRVNNWSRRGLAKNAYPAVAAVLGWSVDRLLAAGAEEAEQPRLSRAALDIALRLDGIADAMTHRAAYMAISETLDAHEARRSLPKATPAPAPSGPRPRGR